MDVFVDEYLCHFCSSSLLTQSAWTCLKFILEPWKIRKKCTALYLFFFTQNLITDFLASWCYRLRLIKLFACVSRKFICLLTFMNNCWMIVHASECVGSQNYHLFFLLQKVCFIMFIFVKIISTCNNSHRYNLCSENISSDSRVWELHDYFRFWFTHYILLLWHLFK